MEKNKFKDEVLPQSCGLVSVHISGKEMDISEGYNLKYLVDCLHSFERLSEKTYLYLVNKDKFGKREANDFGIYIKNIRKGSFKADLWINFQTYLLPLIPFIGEHGDIIWNCMLNTFDYLKTISEAKQQGKIVTIENVGDRTQVIVGDNNVVNIYPNYVPELSSKLSKEFAEIAKNMDGNIDSVSFTHQTDGNLVINGENKDLFKEKEFLLSEEEIILGSITVLNSHNNTGKIDVLKGDIPKGEYKFEVQKDIRYPEYLASSMKKEVQYRCYVKMKYDPSTMKETISGLRIIAKL